MKFRLLLICLIASLIAPAFSQELKAGSRTCRFVFPERPAGSPRFVYVYDGSKNHQILLSGVQFSEVLKLRQGEMTLVIGTKPVTDPENIPQNYPRLKLPETLKNFYVFVSADKENKNFPLRFQMVNIDTKNFDPGDTLWYNFTSHDIRALLGKSKLTLGPRKTSISKKALEKSGYFVAQFDFRPNGKGAWRDITEQKWWLDVESRYVGFVANRGGRLPTIYMFRDFRSKLTDKQRKEIEDADIGEPEDLSVPNEDEKEAANNQ